MRNLLGLAILLMLCSLCKLGYSQNAQVGVLLAGSVYHGEIGPELPVVPTNVAFSIFFNKGLSSRIMLKSSLEYYSVKASDSDAKEDSKRKKRGHSFFNPVGALSGVLELHLFKMRSKKKIVHSPYFLFGLSGIIYKENYHKYIFHSKTNIKKEHAADLALNFAVPFGIGYKVMIQKKITIGVQLQANYTFTKNIDNTAISLERYKSRAISPKGDVSSEFISDHLKKEIAKSGYLNKQNDWIFSVGITLAYSLGKSK